MSKPPLFDYPYNFVLGSKSPRRFDLLKQLGINFKVRSSKGDESYLKSIKLDLVPQFLAKQKAELLRESLSSKELLLTFDTMVLDAEKQKLLGKPNNKKQAKEMLQSLSGKMHWVITGSCFTTKNRQMSFCCKTKVYFSELSASEINYYLECFDFLDKAGSYGVQDWIGLIAVEKIVGNYQNVVGLPTAQVYEKLLKFCS